MGLENIKCTQIKYNEVNKKPYFSSILESAKSLLKSCIEEKEKLLNIMKNDKTPNIKDIVDCILLCYLYPILKLQHIDRCENEYKVIIKDVKEQLYYDSIDEKIKKLSYVIATDNAKNGGRGSMIHAVQSSPRVGLFCKELEKFSKKEGKLNIDVSLCPNLWKELSNCGNPIEWHILKTVFETNDIDASSLSVWCNERIKKIDVSYDGIGYFKKLYSVTIDIAMGNIEIAELHNKGKSSETDKSKAMNKEEENSKPKESKNKVKKLISIFDPKKK